MYRRLMEHYLIIFVDSITSDSNISDWSDLVWGSTIKVGKQFEKFGCAWRDIINYIF